MWQNELTNLYPSTMKRILLLSSFLAIFFGIIFVGGGIWGLTYTYKNVAQENITTPADASIPNTPVRGPLTLKAQTDIIRVHTLRMTEGKTFSEMPRQIPKLDENGNQILDENGKAIMTANTARDIWITATTLITALNLGIFAYAFASFVLLFGFFSIWTGVIFYTLSRKY